VIAEELQFSSPVSGLVHWHIATLCGNAASPSTSRPPSGTYYGSVRPDIDFPMLADLDMDKRLNLDDLISRTYKFDEINEGFRLLLSGSVARGVIAFD
jgi:Zn-dependent alcohol dehydrogenase